MIDQSTSSTRRLSKRSCSIGESITLAIAAEARWMQAEGIRVISFSTGEPDFPTPDRIKRAGIEAIETNFTRYTAAEGIPELRKAAAEKFSNDNGMPTEPSQVLITAGGKQGIFNALMAVVDDGDEVLIPTPYWTSYPDLVRLTGGTPVLVRAADDARYKVTADQLREAITPKTRAIILNTPSNPTGVMYTAEELAAFAAVIAEAGIYAISDELYERIVYDGNRHVSIGSFPELADLGITINGVSKAYAMTGWRIGYMRGPKDVIAAAARVQSQATSHPSTISMRAALTALTSVRDEVEQMVAAFARRRDLIVELASAAPAFEFPHPDGAFYLFIDVQKYFCERVPNDVEMVSYLLKEHHVATVPGSAFGDGRAIRLSYACSEADIIEGMARIRKGLEAL